MKISQLSISGKLCEIKFFEFIAGLLLVYILFIRFVYIFTYDTDLEGVEFALVHFVQMIVLKGHLYWNAAKFPYLLVVHAPFYYYSMAGVMKLFSIDVVKDVHLMYIIGRAISFFLLFINFYFLIRMVKLLSQQYKYKIFLLLIFTLFLPNHFFACRPDSFKVTFFIIFLYFSIKYFKNENWIHNLLAILFLMLCIFSKQDILIYGLLLYMVFFIMKRKIIFIISPLLVLIILFACIYLYELYSGINLLKELVFYNIQYDNDLHINFVLIFCYYIRIFPMLALTFLNLKSKNKLSISLSLLSLSYLIVSSLLMLRSGASFNYIYESVILLLLNVVIFSEESKTKIHKYVTSLSSFLIAAYISFLFLFNLIIYYKPYFLAKTELKYKNEFFSSLQTSKKIKSIVGENVLFIPDMKFYIYYPDMKLIYGTDWHFDRYCEIALDIKIKPKYIMNEIIAEYDKQFTNGLVQFILVENNDKSKKHLKVYYPYFTTYREIDNFIIYRFQKNSSFNLKGTE